MPPTTITRPSRGPLVSNACSSFAISTTLERDFPALKTANAPGHTFVVLEVEPFSDAEQKLEQPPFDGPELKFRFGRHVESLTGCDIFGYRI